MSIKVHSCFKVQVLSGLYSSNEYLVYIFLWCPLM